MSAELSTDILRLYDVKSVFSIYIGRLSFILISQFLTIVKQIFYHKKWPFSRLFAAKRPNRLLTIDLFVSLSGLFNQLNQTGDLGLGLCRHQSIELVLG